MAVMKVHGSMISPATRKILACLYEKELEFEFVPIDMRKDEDKKEPFISLNPFGEVPAFEDGDLKLFEPRVITRYIAHEYADKGTQLICPGKQMAILSVWMEVEAHKFDPVAVQLVWEQAVKPVLLGMDIDATAVEENEVSLAQVLDVYETRLAQSKFLACDYFSLADLHHIPVIMFLLGTQSKKLFDSRPHVSAWVADITARPAWSKVLAMQNANLV